MESLKIVQHGKAIRGFINTEIPFVNNVGENREGTTIFIEGAVSQSGSIAVHLSGHQCNTEAPICSADRRSNGKLMPVEFKKAGRAKIQVRLDARGDSLFPFSSATFKSIGGTAQGPFGGKRT